MTDRTPFLTKCCVPTRYNYFCDPQEKLSCRRLHKLTVSLAMRYVSLTIICLVLASCAGMNVEQKCDPEAKYSVDWFRVIERNGGFSPINAINIKLEATYKELENKLKNSESPGFWANLTIADQKAYATEVFDLTRSLTSIRNEKNEMSHVLLRLYSSHLQELRGEVDGKILTIFQDEDHAGCELTDLTPELVGRVAGSYKLTNKGSGR